MKRIILIVFLIIIVKNIFADTWYNVEYNCPLCGEIVEAYAYASYSFANLGQGLDLRRLGFGDMPLPKCTNCNFVFRDNFFTSREIEILRNEFLQNNIFEIEPDMPSYYYLAREAEIVGRDLADIAWFFLSSVWENDDVNRKNRLINITIEYIDQLNESNQAYNNFQLVKLDLLRRSGQFNKALEVIEEIKNNEKFYKDIIVIIINRQIELIENLDQEEHPIPSDR